MMRTSTLIGCVPPSRSNSSLLQDAQQLGLHVQRQLADFVEEQRADCGRPRSGRFAAPTAPVNAPRSWPNSSLSISVLGIAAQLTRIIWPVPPVAEFVNLLCEHFFADAGFAEQQHGRGRRRDLLCLGECEPDGRRFPHDRLQRAGCSRIHRDGTVGLTPRPPDGTMAIRGYTPGRAVRPGR